MAKALSIILTAALFVALPGCPKPANPDRSEAAKAIERAPVAKIAVKAAPLSDAHCEEVQAKEDSLAAEQAHQKIVRHWLYVIAALTILAGALGIAAKIMQSKVAALAASAAGPQGWAAKGLLALAPHAHWPSIAVDLAIGAACIVGAIWLDPIWGVVKGLFWLAVGIGIARLAVEFGIRYGRKHPAAAPKA